jgi:hypothetical protein
MRYRNVGSRRVWPTLADELTGHTLELDAGEECELASEVEDPYLEPVGADAASAQAVLSDEPAAQPVVQTAG